LFLFLTMEIRPGFSLNPGYTCSKNNSYFPM
jgi:hypothetical protein